jgi:hypothetical protein
MIVDFDYFKAGIAEEQDWSIARRTSILIAGKGMSVQGPTSFSRSTHYDLRKVEEKNFITIKHGVEIPYKGFESTWIITHDLDTELIEKATKGWFDEQRTHRCRIASLGGGEMMTTELNYKIAVFKALINKLKPVDSSIEYELFIKILNDLKSCITTDHFEKFVSEHKHSNVSPGTPWTSLPPEAANELAQYWSAFKSHLIENQGSLDQMHWNRPYHIGMRGRTTEKYEPGKTVYVTTVDRSRIIVFEPHQSTLFSVIDPERFKAAKKQLMENWRKQTGLEAYQAYADGVDVYLKFPQLLSQGQYRAYDGISWETWVPSILPWFKMFGTPYEEGVLALYTGGGFTTLGGMLAALALHRSQKYADSSALIGNSDDMGTVFYDKPSPPIIPLDESLLDTKLKFMLGLSYVNPDLPHPIGIKLTRDRSDAHEPYIKGMAPLVRTITEREMEIVAEVYQGRVGNDTLIDHLRLNEDLITSMDYFSPSKMIGDLVDRENRRRDSEQT